MEFIQFLQPWMIPIIIMICVTLIVIITSVTKIITTSMTRKEGKSLSENKEFLDALRDFKESIDQRVANLEEIAASESSNRTSVKRESTKERKPQSAIEIELEDRRQSQKESSRDSSKLRNMLNQ